MYECTLNKYFTQNTKLNDFKQKPEAIYMKIAALQSGDLYIICYTYSTSSTPNELIVFLFFYLGCYMTGSTIYLTLCCCIKHIKYLKDFTAWCG